MAIGVLNVCDQLGALADEEGTSYIGDRSSPSPTRPYMARNRNKTKLAAVLKEFGASK